MAKLKSLHLSSEVKPSSNGSTNKLDVFINQLIDSAIVGGIAGISAYVSAGIDATPKVFALAFGLTFLIKLKDYRGIK